MAEIIKMPRLSDTMTEGKVAKWNKKVGEKLNEGDVIAEIETDKAVQDFESEYDGVLLYQGVKEGETSSLDAILAIIGEEGEDISSLISGGNNNSVDATKEEPKAETVSEPDENNNSVSVDFEIPEGIEIITMPRLSDTMTEGKVAKWNKNVGDSVNEGDIIAEIETDKAVQDFESEYDGVLLYQGVKEGEASALEAILAIIGPTGTDITAVVANFSSKPVTTKKNSTEISSNPSTQVKTKIDIENTVDEQGRILASPLAKKIAEDKGIDLRKIKGSGENGRITKKDIEDFKPQTEQTSVISESTYTSSATPKAVQLQIPIVTGVDSEIPNTQMRNIIAKRLADSKFTAPHYYLISEIDMDNAIQSRNTINSIPDTKISFNDLVIKAVATALKKHSAINSSWGGDKIVYHGNINVGVAVAIDEGLVVPVLKNADYQSLTQISAAVKDLAVRARNRKLKANEMEGSTFSVSNMGMFGIENFTSIINQPNSCILSVGAIIEKPVVKNGQIVVGNTMKVSLACDHRVVDGATGAAFLETLKQFLENPVTILA